MTHPSPSPDSYREGGDCWNLFSDLETVRFINNKLTSNNFYYPKSYLCKEFNMEYKILKYNKTESTNLSAMEMVAADKAENGLVLLTDFQTSGKGAGNNSWESENGKNLLFSIIITPENIEPAKQFLITQIISLAIVYSLKNNIPDIKIKWPNDIYAGDKKIAGILIQNIISANRIAFSIIGVGLNVNQKHFPKEIPNPVSILNLTKKETDRNKLLKIILKNFDNTYNLSINNAETINKEYLSYLYRYNTYSHYKAGKNTFEAKIKGITQYGQLILEEKNGKEKVFNFKEVTFVS